MRIFLRGGKHGRSDLGADCMHLNHEIAEKNRFLYNRKVSWMRFAEIFNGNVAEINTLF
jgi:hypothetical protein